MSCMSSCKSKRFQICQQQELRLCKAPCSWNLQSQMKNVLTVLFQWDKSHPQDALNHVRKKEFPTMYKMIALAVFILSVSCAAQAQDPTKVDSQHYTVEFE